MILPRESQKLISKYSYDLLIVIGGDYKKKFAFFIRTGESGNNEKIYSSEPRFSTPKEAARELIETLELTLPYQSLLTWVKERLKEDCVVQTCKAPHSH